MSRRPDPSEDVEERSGEVDLAALRTIVLRKKYWIIVPTILSFALIAVFVTVVTPRYTAESQVLLENQETFFTRPERSQTPPDPTSPVDPEAVGSQIQIITSRDLERRAIRELGLIGNPEFDPLAKGIGPVTRVLALLGLARDPTRSAAEDRVLDAFQDRLTVFSPPKTRVITIQFQSKDPNLAARTANKLADLYIGMQSDAKRENAKAAAASLTTSIGQLRTKLAKANADAEAYRSKSGLLAGSNNMTISGQQLAELNSELSKARTAQADAQAKASLIRDMIRKGRISEIPDVANNDLVRRIAEQRVTLRAQLALEARTLLPQHPRMKELQAQLADLDGQIRALAERTARTLENDARVAGARVTNLEIALNQQKQVASLANVDEVHLRELERISHAYKDQLDSSTTKYQEAVARENSQSTPADARVFSRAFPPEIPSFPRKLPLLVFGTLATFVMMLGAILAAALLSGRAYVPVESKVRQRGADQTPFLARVKEFGASAAASRAAEAAPQAETGDAHAAEELAEQIKAGRDAGRGTRILAAGLTTTATAAATDIAVALARRLSREGRAIIIDLDEHASLVDRLAGHSQVAPGDMAGLSDLLAGHASFAEVIHRDIASRLHFVPGGNETAADLRDLDLVFDALTETYDFVLIIVPALDAKDQAYDLAAQADFIVLAAQDAAGDVIKSASYGRLVEAGAGEVLLVGPRPEAPVDVSQSVA